MSDAIGAALGVIMLAIMAIVGLAILGPVVTEVSNMGVGEGSASFAPDAGNSTVIKSSLGDGDLAIDVAATRENAVFLNATGHLDTSAPSDWDNGSWTACVVAEPATGEPGWNPNATYDALAIENETLLIQWDAGNWRGTFRGNNGSATVTVDATATQTPVCTTFNESTDEFTIHAEGSTATNTLDSNPAVTNVSDSWLGMLDEVRLIETDAPSGQISAYQSDPVRPLSVPHTGRWMLDEGEGTASTGYYDAGSATLVSASWTSGVSDPGLDEGADYTLSFQPFAVTTVSGGYLDGAPVAYVSWTSPLGGAFTNIVGGVGSAFNLLPVVMIVLVAASIVAVTTRLQ